MRIFKHMLKSTGEPILIGKRFNGGQVRYHRHNNSWRTYPWNKRVTVATVLACRKYIKEKGLEV